MSEQPAWKRLHTRLGVLWLVCFLGCTLTALAPSRAGASTFAAASAALGALSFVLAQNQRRKREVQSEQARRAAIVDGSSDAIIGETLDGTITDWNRAAERLFGHSREVAVGSRAAALILPEDRADEDADIRARIASGASVPAFDTTRRRADGSLVHVSVTASPIVSPDGKRIGFSKLVRDISERKLAEAQIRDLNASLERQVLARTELLDTALSRQLESNSQLAAALREREALLGAIREYAIVSTTDCAGRIIEVNDRFCEATGYRREELLGRDHRVVSSGMMPSAFWSEMWTTISAGKAWRGEICNRAKDGSTSWVDCMIAPFLDEAGAIEKFVSIRFDITAAKRSERALLDSRAFLDRAGKVARVGAWELDVATQQIVWSTEMYRIHELEPGTAPDLAAAIDFYPPHDREFVERTVRAAIETKQGWDFELPFTTATGRQLWVRSVGEVECEAGVPVRLVGTMQDLTARREVDLARANIEAELQKTHERISMAADAAGIGVWELDIASASLVWDDWMYRLYGQPVGNRSEPYELWAGSVHPDDRAEAERKTNEAIAGKVSFEIEFRIIRPDNQIRHIKAAARVVRDSEGRAVRMTGVNFDITERKRAEVELGETSALLKAVLGSASEVSMIATDPNMLIRVFNTGAERLLGYSNDEVVGRVTPALFHDADEVAVRAAELSALSGKHVTGGGAFVHPLALGQAREWTYVRKDGRRVPVSLVVTAMHDEDGQLSGYLGVAYDVTRQKLDELSLREATRRAEQASVAKSEFLANMSHEIRTPMNGVLGLTYLLGQTRLDAEQAAFVSQISASGSSLLALINDILDFSKIEAGELSLESAPFRLSEVLQRVQDATSLQTRRKGLSFALQATGVPDELEGDVTRLEQILTNLLSNAVKFTARGGVTLRVKAEGPVRHSVKLRFEVEDTGIGLAPEEQVRLFRPFAQADASTTRRFGGTGLGLSIVKRLSELMGGDVGLTSHLDRGSTFWVVLELAVRPMSLVTRRSSASDPIAPNLLQGVRVLLVDDSDINLEVARHVLERQGARVTAASNGEQAVSRLVAQPNEFDAVLMDVQMPHMDGHQAARRIRQLGLGSLPIIALTADARTSERARTLAAGMNDFISKPFDPPALIRCVLRHVQDVRAVAPLSGSRRSRPPPAEAARPAVGRGAWPRIEGIDAADASARFSGDVDFFRVLLCRFFVDFSHVARLGEEFEAAPLAAQGERMHKLRGSAGQLGAQTIQRLALQVENACRANDAARARLASRALAAQFEELQSAVRSSAELAFPPEAWRPDQAPLDARGLLRVAELLRKQDLSVLVEIEALAPGLRKALGEDAYRAFNDYIERLRFQEAAIALERRGASLQLVGAGY